jgi:cell cycle serine/threonine-protein kinase CDC5/MSD2
MLELRRLTSSEHNPLPQHGLVAIKILDKAKLKAIDNGLRNLAQEIMVHWALEECGSML